MIFSMDELKQYIKNQWQSAYHSIDQDELEDIYVFSFFVYDDEDNPFKPTLTIGYNTLSNFDREKTRASNDQEAKWNYAFWLQNNLASIGQNDVIGAALIEDWISTMELQYTGQDDSFDPLIFEGKKITDNFVAMLVRIVQDSHSEGLTNLPILIHELEYYDEIRDQNILANGEERVTEFKVWIDEMYDGI